MQPGERYELRGYGIVEVLNASRYRALVIRLAPGCTDEPAKEVEPASLIPIAWPTVGHYGAR